MHHYFAIAIYVSMKGEPGHISTAVSAMSRVKEILPRDEDVEYDLRLLERLAAKDVSTFSFLMSIELSC